MTKKNIQDAFLAMMQEKPFNQFTVTELVKRAGINRTTFYKHYLDVQDLLEQIEDDLLAKLRSLVADLWDCYADPEAVTAEVLRRIRDDSERYACLGSRNGDPALSGKTFRMIYEVFYPILTENLPCLSEAERQMLYYYLSQGCGGILLWWIRHDMRDPPEQIAAFIINLVRRTLAGTSDEVETKA